MKESLTESQLKAKIYQMVREQLEEAQPQQEEQESPADDLKYLAERCARLQYILETSAQKLDIAIKNTYNELSKVFGQLPPLKINDISNSNDSIELHINFAQNNIDALRQYIINNRSEVESEFGEYGDFAGENFDEVINNNEMLLSLFESHFSDDMVEYDLNPSSIRPLLVTLRTYYTSNCIYIDINMPFNVEEVEKFLTPEDNPIGDF